MKNMLYIAATMLLCSSCFHVNTNWNGGKNAVKGEGPVVTKSFDLKDFDAICVNGNADVVFTQADAWEVTVRTQENVIDELDYRVESGKLIIEAKDHRTIRAEVYDLTVKAPDLKEIEVNGAADFKIPAGLRTEGNMKVEVNGAGDLSFKGIACGDLKIETNGASDIEALDINSKSLVIRINGAGDVDVTGKTGDATLEVNGAGDINASGLKATGEVKKRSSGLAKITL